MDIKTFRCTTPSSVGRSGIDRSIPDLPTDDGVVRQNVLMSIPTIHRTFTIDLTASLCRVNRGLCITHLSEIMSCRLPHLNWIAVVNITGLNLSLQWLDGGKQGCSGAGIIPVSSCPFGLSKFQEVRPASSSFQLPKSSSHCVIGTVAERMFCKKDSSD